jgi:DNA-directed RNA polymerase specialized sigma24 family protein
VEDQAYGEIAVAAGVSEAAIRQRVSRGLATLRERLGGER